MTKQKRGNTQMTKMRDEKRDITTDLIERYKDCKVIS